MLVSAENLQPFGGDWPVWLYFRLCGNDFRHLGTPNHEGTPKEDRGLGLGTGRGTSDKGRAHSEEKKSQLDFRCSSRKNGSWESGRGNDAGCNVSWKKVGYQHTQSFPAALRERLVRDVKRIAYVCKNREQSGWAYDPACIKPSTPRFRGPQVPLKRCPPYIDSGQRKPKSHQVITSGTVKPMATA